MLIEAARQGVGGATDSLFSSYSTMVVQVSTEAGSSQPKKNRRKLSKKAGKSVTKSTTIDVEGDTEMRGNVLDVLQEDDEMIINTEPLPTSSAPSFPLISASVAGRSALKSESRKIPMPPHRMTPLKKDWVNIFGPLTEILGLQVRMNVPRKCVELRVRSASSRAGLVLIQIIQTSKHTKEIGSIQKGADFVKAYALGFDVNVSVPT